MNLYDDALRRLWELLPRTPDRTAAYSPSLCAPEGNKSEILFSGDTAYELGGGGKPSVCGVLFGAPTADRDEVVLYGPDLCELDRDAPFAHFTVVSLKDDGKDAQYAEQLKDVAFRVFQLYPAGFHIRISPSLAKEQARVAKAALRQTPPLSLINVGCSLIRLFKEHPLTDRVKTIFVTRPDVDFTALSALGRKAKQITDAVESMAGDNPLDCAACKMKPICDEVDGLRELHFKSQKERIGER